MSTNHEIRLASPTSRDLLRARHDEELALLNAFLGYDIKVTRARAALQTLEAHQRSALGHLAASAGVDIAAELTGIAIAKVREAAVGQRPKTSATESSASVR